MDPFVSRFRRWFICLTVVIALLAIVAAPRFWSGPRSPGIPFGCMEIPGANAVGMQDFAINTNYIREIANRRMAHPYRLADQEQAVHRWFPRAGEGFAHAYSPVALVIVSPLLLFAPEQAYFAWTVINAALLVALTSGFLLPRLRNVTQGMALIVLFCSYLLLDLFNMGQTALLTTSLLAAAYVLLAGRSRNGPTWGGDLLLAATLYAVAFKPSVAMVLFALTVGQRAGRPLLISIVGLLLTWAVLAPFYGGYIGGLGDYWHLVRHYCQAEVPVFFQGSVTPAGDTNLMSLATMLNPAWNGPAFHISQLVFEIAVVLVAVLGWRRRIGLSTLFQSLIWIFLLLCPYLLLTEDLALALLVVEGNFFRNGWAGGLKVLMIIGIANIWIGASYHIPLATTLKLVLAGWWLIDLTLRSQRTRPVIT